jgi:hypothetical protein
MVQVLRSKTAKLGDRMTAAMWLTDRGFGKAVPIVPELRGR